MSRYNEPQPENPKRVPFEQMNHAWTTQVNLTKTVIEFQAWCNKHGWTMNEYCLAACRMSQSPHKQ